ncbi:uncharacterized protein LOC121004931 [Bufo bufo]|uniref:uncharacterized protein LOC121004931 n=1 Tax=Bufo bufo TaxID=8384 RepID=UPI001ABE824A|nr:uncharacterized protein LOC121004931 [Bufo bufo]
MMEKLCGICLTIFYVQICLSLASNDKVITEVGKKVCLPCGKETNGDIEWFRNERVLMKYTKGNKYYGPKVEDKNRYSVPSHATNDLTVTDVRTEDSDTYTCRHGTSVFRTVKLFVVQVSIRPSTSLLPSEDLVLELTPSSSSVPGLRVSWEKDGSVKSEDPELKVYNVQLNSSGDYVCRLKMDGGSGLDITRHIKIFGFHDSPSIVYTSGTNPVTVPWIFNFDIRSKPLSSDVHVVEGSISYSSQILNQLHMTEGAAGWAAKSHSKDASAKPNDLSVYLLNPKSGDYQMEIVLKIGNRMKNLTRKVCVASLTVSDSRSDIILDAQTPLQCRVNCIDINAKLCWNQWNTSHGICGQQGQSSLDIVTAVNESEAIWTCSVIKGKERLISATVTLAVESDFLVLSNSMLWVAVGVGIVILLLIVVIITLVIARNRRVRRARHRAWLLQNLHQQRKCECKGFAPQRLREKI